MAKRVAINIDVDAKKGIDSINKTTNSIVKLDTKTKNATKDMAKGFSNVKTALIGILSLGVFTALSENIIQTSVTVDNLDRAFKAITGSTEAAAQSMKFVSDTANELGFNYIKLANSYKLLAASAQGTSLAGAKVQKIFKSIITAGSVVGATNDELNRAFNQLSQGIGKTVFGLEDLKTIAEALPGVGMSDFAKAVGVSTQEFLKMVSAGQIISTTFIPQLADALENKFGKAAKDASNSARANFARFGNTITKLKNTLGRSFLPAINNVVKATNEWMKANKEVVNTKIKSYSESLLNILKKLAPIIKVVANHIKLLSTALLVLVGINIVGWLAPVFVSLGRFITLVIQMTIEVGSFGTAIQVLTMGGLTGFLTKIGLVGPLLDKMLFKLRIIAKTMPLVFSASVGYAIGSWLNGFKVVQSAAQKFFNLVTYLGKYTALKITAGFSKALDSISIAWKKVNSLFGRDVTIHLHYKDNKKDLDKIKQTFNQINADIDRDMNKVASNKGPVFTFSMPKNTDALVRTQLNKIFNDIDASQSDIRTSYKAHLKATQAILTEMYKKRLSLNNKNRELDIINAKEYYNKLLNKFKDNSEATIAITNTMRLALQKINTKYDKAALEKLKEAQEKEAAAYAAAQKVKTEATKKQLEEVFSSLDKAQEKLNKFFTKTDAIINNINDKFAGGLVDGILEWTKGITTAERAFRKFASSFLEDIAKMILKQSILNSLKSVSSSSSGWLSKGATFVAGLIGGKASGGPVNKDQTYLVGENGPELFTPNTNGNITSNDNITSGGGMSIVNNISIKSSGSDDEGLAKKTAAAIETKIKEIIGQQKRYGGLLYG